MAAQGSLSPAEYQRTGAATLSKTAYHFRALKKAAVITLHETRQARGATEHVYRLSASSIAVRALLAVVFATQAEDEDGKDFSTLDSPLVDLTIEAAFSIEVDDHGIRELQSVVSEALPRALSTIRRRTRERAALSQDQQLRQLRLAVAASGSSDSIE
jgi:hypothetical protein